MRKLIKFISGKTLKPLVARYLQKPRSFKQKGIQMVVNPGVFHPRLFFSTKFLNSFIEKLPLNGQTFLELGAGSGFISIAASKRGARVSASDISLAAVENIRINSRLNHADLNIYHSDLFENIPEQKFDYIIINPPYFRGKPSGESDYAWFAGENLEYFSGLFFQLPKFIQPQSAIFMVLSDEVEFLEIQNIALEHQMVMKEICRKRFWWEKNLIFEITPKKHFGI